MRNEISQYRTGVFRMTKEENYKRLMLNHIDLMINRLRRLKRSIDKEDIDMLSNIEKKTGIKLTKIKQLLKRFV